MYFKFELLGSLLEPGDMLVVTAMSWPISYTISGVTVEHYSMMGYNRKITLHCKDFQKLNYLQYHKILADTSTVLQHKSRF